MREIMGIDVFITFRISDLLRFWYVYRTTHGALKEVIPIRGDYWKLPKEKMAMKSIIHVPIESNTCQYP